MAGSGRSISLQAASWPALVLQVAAVVLGLLAALCWFGVGVSPVQLAGTGSTGPELHWWSASVAVVGIVVALLIWFAAGVRGRVGALVLVVLFLGLGVGAVLFFRLVVPTANPIHPLGSAVPYALAGFVAAGLACLLAAGSIAVAGVSPKAQSDRWTIGPRTGLVAGCLALVLAAGAGLVVVDWSRDYLLGANEYRTSGDVDREPAGSPASTLSGGNHWQIEVPGLTLMRPALTDFGLGLASGQNVIMVDRATGDIRWTYTRSDEPGRVSVAGTGGGRQVLAWWGSGQVYVLDARTGERVGHWSIAEGEARILEPALPLVARTDSDGRTAISRLDTDGHDLWTYRLGPCAGARSTLAENAVIVSVTSGCGDPSGRLIALDPTTGGVLWSTHQPGDVRAVVPGTAYLVTPPGDAGRAGSLTAVDLEDGSTRWTRQLPRSRESTLPCGDIDLRAGEQFAVLVCTWDLTDYPAGAQQFSSTVFGYDGLSGSLVQSATYRSAPVVATAVTEDHRVIVARADAPEGWLLDVAMPQTSQRSLSIAPYLDSHATARGLVVFGDQVLVVDAALETLRCLR